MSSLDTSSWERQGTDGTEGTEARFCIFKNTPRSNKYKVTELTEQQINAEMKMFENQRGCLCIRMYLLTQNIHTVIEYFLFLS